MVKRRTKRRKSKGHPGFSKKCKAKGWTFKQWEDQVKKFKRARGGINPYALTNKHCAIHPPRKRSRRRRR